MGQKVRKLRTIWRIDAQVRAQKYSSASGRKAKMQKSRSSWRCRKEVQGSSGRRRPTATGVVGRENLTGVTHRKACGDCRPLRYEEFPIGESVVHKSRRLGGWTRAEMRDGALGDSGRKEGGGSEEEDREISGALGSGAGTFRESDEEDDEEDEEGNNRTSSSCGGDGEG
jgi:hypothetical protein